MTQSIRQHYKKNQKPTKSPILKNIHKINNKYYIIKSIKGKQHTYGNFKKLNDAINHRDKLIENNWEHIPLPEEILYEKEQTKYYLGISHTGSRNKPYKLRNKHGKYLYTFKTIEEALYYRDQYYNINRDEAPSPDDLNLKIDNPYIINGLEYPLPERLKKQYNETRYGKGTIVKKGPSSYHIYHGKKGNGFKSYYCACTTYEQAYYVREELNKGNWNREEISRILDGYTEWYNRLLKLYQYIVPAPKKGNGWQIEITAKNNPDKTGLKFLGGYRSIEDALYERDFLRDNDWDYDLLVETINDDENPYYSMDLPPYPERKIQGFRDLDTHKKELIQIADLILEYPSITQREIAEILDIIDVSLRNWLKLWNTTWKEFKQIVLSGDDPFSLLEEPVQLYTPDLSKNMPSNFKGYVHQNNRSKKSPYRIMRKGIDYGSYSSEKLARKIVRDLIKCDWDKNQLKSIQAKHGHISVVNSKRFVYKQRYGWAVRRKNKECRMLTYGTFKDYDVAVAFRDCLDLYGWDITTVDELKELVVWCMYCKRLFEGKMF